MKPGLALQPAPTTGEHPAVHAPNKRDQLLHRIMSAFGGKADIGLRCRNVRS